jgi:hypothetical protein
MILAAMQMMMYALRAHWGTLALLVVCLHWPLDVLESYITYHWVDPDNLRAAFRVSRTIDQFARVIPDAAIFFVIRCGLDREAVGFGSSLAEGVRAYGRMWLTRFMGYLSFLSLLLLVIPGVYWLTRWSFSEASVIGGNKAGSSAFGQSWKLTRGRFWSVFGAVLAGFLVYAIGALAIGAGTLIVEEWWMDVLTTMLSSLLRPIWLAYLFCLYAYLLREHDAAPMTQPPMT